jgi:hypothetical protein
MDFISSPLFIFIWGLAIGAADSFPSRVSNPEVQTFRCPLRERRKIEGNKGFCIVIEGLCQFFFGPHSGTGNRVPEETPPEGITNYPHAFVALQRIQGSTRIFIKKPLEYPSACWRDEKGFAEGEYF